MSDRIDITEPLHEICARLGLEPSNVGSLRLKPGEAEADIYLTNESGSKYVNEDGEAAKESRKFRVKS